MTGASLPTGMGKRIILNADLHGFGDLCVTAFMSEGSKGHDPELIHWATGAKRTVLEMFGQTIADSPAGSVDTFAAYAVELRQGGAIPRVVSRGHELGITTPPKRPTVTIPAECHRWAAEQHQTGKPLVLVYPHTCYKSREYPAPYWVDLCWLLHEAGYDVRLFEEVRDERYDSVPLYYWGQDWPHMAAMMQRASVVIGNDSGPVHVAGVLDIPALALCGPTTASVFAHVPSVQVVTSDASCTGCYFGSPFRAACDQGCRSLYELRPERVVEKVQEQTRHENGVYSQ